MYKFIRFFAVIYLKIFFGFKVYGKENVPEEGKMILCGNHSSNNDTLMIAMATKRDIHFMAKEELFKNPIIAWVFRKAHAIPVHRDGNDMLAIRNAIRVLGNGEVLGIFPQGTRDKGGIHKPDAFKTGVATISVKTCSPVVPVYISEEYKLFRRNRIYVGEPINTWEFAPKKPSQEDYDRIANGIIRGAIIELENKWKAEK
ncbi:MAG: 1-acyl-sn-glycerol-3-phosphate acyltransferase [Anaerofustis stercorihominis]|nr:1-acyl-sn-glycerol-3-phosphate acyltransferase [Anaerofustis stercorihominis]